MEDQIVEFYFEDVQFDFNQAIIREWILLVIEGHQKSLKQVQIIFCTDEFLLDINQKYLQHDYYTDIISFPYSVSPIEGELYISVERIRENALLFKVSFEQELHRVIIHGILHLIGFKDETPKEKQDIQMAEDEALKILQNLTQ